MCTFGQWGAEGVSWVVAGGVTTFLTNYLLWLVSPGVQSNFETACRASIRLPLCLEVETQAGQDNLPHQQGNQQLTTPIRHTSTTTLQVGRVTPRSQIPYVEYRIRASSVNMSLGPIVDASIWIRRLCTRVASIRDPTSYRRSSSQWTMRLNEPLVGKDACNPVSSYCCMTWHRADYLQYMNIHT